MAERDRWDEKALTLLPENRHDELSDAKVIAVALREAFKAGRKEGAADMHSQEVDMQYIIDVNARSHRITIAELKEARAEIERLKQKYEPGPK